MREADVVEGAHRHFERTYPDRNVSFCRECDAPVARGRPDLVFVQSKRNVVHVVEAKAHAEDAWGGLMQLDRYPGNHKWLALPYDEYEGSEGGIASACSERGYGLLLIYGQERLHSVVRRWPTRFEGDFLSHYPEAEEMWEG